MHRFPLCERCVLEMISKLEIDFKSMETSIPGIFAAGDIVRGASLVVWAIRDGRDAAVSIQKFFFPHPESFLPVIFTK